MITQSEQHLTDKYGKVAGRRVYEMADYSSQNLRELRKNADFSRREIIEKLADQGVKMHPTTLRRIEDGEQTMKVTEAKAVAEIFGMTLDDLVDEPINEGEAGLRSRMSIMKIEEEQIMLNRYNWLQGLEWLADHIADAGIPHNQSKVTRDVQQYMYDTVQFRDWLRSPDFPSDRDHAEEQLFGGLDRGY